MERATVGVPLSQAATVLLAGAFNLDPTAAASAGGIAARENAFAVPAVAVAAGGMGAVLPPALIALAGVTSVVALKTLYDQGYFDSVLDGTFEAVAAYPECPSRSRPSD